jgi:glyoxylase-like metal-dependent hydrolase (beta-lactamase superfamily II)
MGALPINSFVLRGREPMLVDTGLGAFGDEYVEALAGEVDLEDLRWIWLSHMDADHIGNLGRVLERAPGARILTNFLGMGKMNLAGLDVSRVDLLEPGAVVEIGGRRLHQVRPPYYDAPETIGFFDETERVFFAADAFGALLPEPVAGIAEVDDATLRDGLVGWSSIDAPWLGVADRDALGRTLTAIERLDPAVVLSGHLPLATDGVGSLTRNVANAWCRGVTDAVDPNAVEHVAAAFA